MSKVVPVAGLLSAMLLLLGNCAPSPHFVSCENDAMCHEADSRFHYCADSHCVECVTNAECKNGMVCGGGFCREPRDSARSNGAVRG